MRKTKIVCTLGPATDGIDILKSLIDAGMSVARFNMAHGDYAEHQKRIDDVKKVREILGVPVGIMVDIKGPEVRTGKVETPIPVNEGDNFIFTSDVIEAKGNRCSITYPKIHEDVKAGGLILLNDGLLAMRIEKVEGHDIYCKVLGKGFIGDHKNMHFPDAHLNIPFIREKDINDMDFALKNQVEYIAASFVSRASEVREVRQYLDSHGGDEIDIIAKIENREGVDNIESILEESEGIMVARGDLGVEIPIEEIPNIQKKLLKKCYLCGKRAITATEMLESMTNNARPTRAEVSDVANAVYDGTSAVMLSGETSIGKHPIDVVKTMAKICVQAENNIDYVKQFRNLNVNIANISDAVSHSSVSAAHDLNAKVIVVCSSSGRTARLVSRFRPVTPILCLTPSKVRYEQLALSWGVTPVLVKTYQSIEEIASKAKERAVKEKFARTGDVLVITAGTSSASDGTNLMRIESIK
ncbi:MAG: pyruvate kinase [Bacillales bacterium]|nr:pyruvate kinase [Bacillales bacterium]